MKSAVFDPRIVALLAAGCAVGTARWDVDAARPVGLAERGAFGEALPDAGLHADAWPGRAASPVEPLPLAAARAASEQESQGMGVFGRIQMATFGGTRTLAFKPPAGGFPVRYADVFDPGVGFGATVILSRPPTGKLALGDIFTLLSFEMQFFPWNEEAFAYPYPPWGSVTLSDLDDLTIMSFWLEAKTMLKPMGVTGRLKPYFLLGAGLAHTGEVNASTGFGTDIILDASWVPGLRARLGIEYRAGNVGFFGEFGAQIVGAPSVGPDFPYGNGDPIFYTPFGGGIIINF